MVGVSVAAPVGPMAILCLRRSMVFGRSVGLATGLGVASAHALYSALALVGVHGLLTATDRRTAMQTVGGLVLVGLGARMATVAAPVGREGLRPMSTRAAYASAIGLCLANPLTVVSLAGLFAGLKLADGGV